MSTDTESISPRVKSIWSQSSMHIQRLVYQSNVGNTHDCIFTWHYFTLNATNFSHLYLSLSIGNSIAHLQFTTSADVFCLMGFKPVRNPRLDLTFTQAHRESPRQPYTNEGVEVDFMFYATYLVTFEIMTHLPHRSTLYTGFDQFISAIAS